MDREALCSGDHQHRDRANIDLVVEVKGRSMGLSIGLPISNELTGIGLPTPIGLQVKGPRSC